MKNCPFYGHTMFVSTVPNYSKAFVLMPSDGNQCGLITSSHSPCHMEINQLPVEWRNCPYVSDIRIGTKDFIANEQLKGYK
jgi:hypothetical protein